MKRVLRCTAEVASGLLTVEGQPFHPETWVRTPDVDISFYPQASIVGRLYCTQARYVPLSVESP